MTLISTTQAIAAYQQSGLLADIPLTPPKDTITEAAIARATSIRADLNRLITQAPGDTTRLQRIRDELTDVIHAWKQ